MKKFVEFQTGGHPVSINPDHVASVQTQVTIRSVTEGVEEEVRIRTVDGQFFDVKNSHAEVVAALSGEPEPKGKK